MVHYHTKKNTTIIGLLNTVDTLNNMIDIDTKNIEKRDDFILLHYIPVN
jgi:small nuclear ribonucleoprotein (snRNP)-like protein